MTDKVSHPENYLETALAWSKDFEVKSFTTDDGRDFVLVPQGFSFKDVSDPQRLPERTSASITLDEKSQLINYINRFKQSSTVAFADIDNGVIRAVIDYHSATDGTVTSNPDLCDHHATLILRQSEEFKRWNAISGNMLAQEDFAAFLEENASDLKEPEPGKMLELAMDIYGSTGGAFKNKIDLSSGDRTLHFDQETKVNQKLVIPKKITLEIPIYQGEEPIDLTMLFRYRVREGCVKLGVEWHRALYQKLALFTQIAHDIAEGSGIPVYLGRSD